MSRSPSFAEMLTSIFKAELAEVRVCLPGKITAVSGDGGRVSVQPQLKDRFLESNGTLEEVSLPVIQNVPVQWPRAGNAALTFPLEAGHFVTLFFSDKDMTKWLLNGTETSPDNNRNHHLSDAIAVPGLYPFGEPFTAYSDSNIVLGFDNGKQVHVKPSEVSLGSETPSDFVALASKVDAALILIKGHQHAVGGTSPTLAALGTNTGSSVVRSE